MDSSPSNRVGIRDVARHLGVSLMTVSLALRNSSEVSAATKNKVKIAAEKLGYHPDPEVSRLMSRLRLTRARKGHATIALADISDRPAGYGGRYFLQILEGAQKRAEVLGFRVMKASLAEMRCGVPRLLDILFNRGVTGIVLLPPIRPLTIPLDLDWSHFAVVSTTYAITPHVVHRVVPHEFLNMCLILKRFEKAGLSRIGVLFEYDFDARNLHQFSAAISLLGHADWILHVKSRNSLNRDEIIDWIKSKRLEIIVTPFVEYLQPILERMPADKRPKLYSLGVPVTPDVPHLDQRTYDIGVNAINQLVGMIHHSDFGLMDSPATTMMRGHFIDGLADVEFP
jgi:DNA-binding LacI/PurR family transcriptional regulator